VLIDRTKKGHTSEPYLLLGIIPRLYASNASVTMGLKSMSWNDWIEVRSRLSEEERFLTNIVV